MSSSMQLQVDNPHCAAGQLIKGCVCWTPPGRGEPRADEVMCLELELLGYEQIVSNETDNLSDPNGILRPVTRQRVEKEILVKFPYTLHTFAASKDIDEEDEDKEQSYEYPFEWELPRSLPSSFHFTTTHQTLEIAYQITAKALSTRGQVLLQDTVPLQVQANPYVPTGKAIAMSPLKANILTNVVFPRGAIHWGWSIPSDVVTTGSTVEITIKGENRSQVDLKDFVVRLVETMVWKFTDGMEQKIEHIVASETIEVNQREWMSGNPGQVMAPPTKVTLVIPDETITSKSYTHGSIIRVEHSIVVIAQTDTVRTTNPRLSHPVHLIRRSSMKSD